MPIRAECGLRSCPLNPTTLGRAMKIRHALAGIAVAATLAGTAACEPVDENGTAADRADTKNAAQKDAKNVDAAAPPRRGKSKAAARKEPAGQAQARQSAAQYL